MEFSQQPIHDLLEPWPKELFEKWINLDYL